MRPIATVINRLRAQWSASAHTRRLEIFHAHSSPTAPLARQKVFHYDVTVLRSTNDAEILNDLQRELGSEPTESRSRCIAEYRRRGLRSLRPGDVVSIDGRHYLRGTSGWTRADRSTCASPDAMSLRSVDPRAEHQQVPCSPSDTEVPAMSSQHEAAMRQMHMTQATHDLLRDHEQRRARKQRMLPPEPPQTSPRSQLQPLLGSQDYRILAILLLVGIVIVMVGAVVLGV